MCFHQFGNCASCTKVTLAWVDVLELVVFFCIYRSHDLSVGNGSLSHDVSGTTGGPIASKVERVTLNIWIYYFSVNSWTSQEALVRGIQGALLSGGAPPTCVCCLRFATMTASAVVAVGISLPTFRTQNDNARGENMCLLLLQHYSAETQLFHNRVSQNILLEFSI